MNEISKNLKSPDGIKDYQLESILSTLVD